MKKARKSKTTAGKTTRKASSKTSPGSRSKVSKKASNKVSKKGGKKAAKKTARKKPVRRQASGSWLSLTGQGLLRVCAGLIGLTVGATAIWIYTINQQVVEHFEQRRWDLPSRVYARPLVLAVGDTLTREQLQTELVQGGYRRAAAVDQPGQYWLDDDQWRIFSRPFVFDDGLQGALSMGIRVRDERIVELTSNGQKTGLLRLDPAEIGSIHALSGEDRKVLGIAQFPTLLVTGVQSIEDRNFKHHYGVDLRGLARAVVTNLRSGKLRQGGSTITQQLVRNLYLSHDRTLRRKINEMIMAVALERQFSKRELLETYLNEVYMGQQSGRPIHGFVRASEHYFGSPVQSLQPDQIALLIGMVRGASWYNPRRNGERALARRNVVLTSFSRTGLLDPARLEYWQTRPLGVRDNAATRTARYPAFMDLVRQQLRSTYADDDLQRAGLRIITTLDPYQQQQAEQAVVELDAVEQRLGTSDLQTGIVMLDPQTGDVMAVVGDRQPNRVGFNRALQARRQIGSIVKPFVYLQALNDPDYTLASIIDDSPIQVTTDNGEIWRPQNYDRQSHGQPNVLHSLINSYNQATVRLGMDIGVEKVRDQLAQLGLVNANHPINPSLLLGALEATPLQVASAYQPLAAAGYRAPPSAVRDVLNADGEALTRFTVQLRSLPQRKAINLLTYALSQTPQQGTARRLSHHLGKPVDIAAKTGTTNDQRDSWFVGYAADKLAVVWVGRDDNQAANVTGASAAMPVWATLFADQPLQPLDSQSLPNLVWYWIDERTGLLTEPECMAAAVLPFLPRTEPRQWSECFALDAGLVGQ